eukprot:5469815-Prymnesium_polylepis.1
MDAVGHQDLAVLFVVRRPEAPHPAHLCRIGVEELRPAVARDVALAEVRGRRQLEHVDVRIHRGGRPRQLPDCGT